MQEKLQRFYELIKKSNCIAIAGHISPDGDAVAASLSLALAIVKKFGIKPYVLLEKFSDKYKFYPGQEFIFNGNYKDLNIDLFISVDCGSIDRLGELKESFLKAKNNVNIDHHISNDNFANLNFVDTNSSSTSQIIFEIIKNLDILDKEIATLIYSGIVFDTCGFKHSCTTQKTHEIAGVLLSYGLDSSAIHNNILYSKTISKAKVFSKAIDNSQIYKNLCYSTLSKEEIIQKCNAIYDDIEGLSSYLLDIEGIDISVLFFEKLDGTIKVSFRSKQIDVNKIASIFGGGGHKLASGATLNLPLNEVKEKVISEIKKYI